MKRLKYCILGLLAAFSLGFYSCQNDDVSDPNKTDNGEQIWTVASSDMTTKSGWSRATIHSGLKTYKTGQTAIIKADLGSTISGNSEHGRGSIGNTYTSGGYACADITNINDNWVVEANFPNYSVTVEAGTGGTASGGGSAIDWGKSCDISATANSGYSFNGWTIKSGSGSFGKSSDAKTTFSPTSDCTVTANFKQDEVKPTKIYVNFAVDLSSDSKSLIARAELSKSNIGNPSITVKATGLYKRGSTSATVHFSVVIGANSSSGEQTVKPAGASTIDYDYDSTEITTVSPTTWTGSDGTQYELSY